MSTLATADLPSEDEADQDFVPTLTSLHAEGDNHQGSSASSDSDGERPKKRRKKSAATANVPQEETCVFWLVIGVFGSETALPGSARRT